MKKLRYLTMEQQFIINGRFLVDPLTNLLIDRETGLTTRLEARLIKVLCILTTTGGRTVLRETLVKEIWQNYGGGDEGLTQAISALRKVLGDTPKKIIVTVPKKGYLFTGTVSSPAQVALKIRSRKIPTITGGGIFVTSLFLLVIIFYLSNTFKHTAPSANNTIYKPLSAAIEKNTGENEANLVAYYDKERNLYKWVTNGDAQPQFYINNIQVPIGQWESHMAIISYLKQKMREKVHHRYHKEVS